MKWRKDPSKQDGPVSPAEEKLKLERQLETMRQEIEDEINGGQSQERNVEKTPQREQEGSNGSNSDRSDNGKNNLIATDTQVSSSEELDEA